MKSILSILVIGTIGVSSWLYMSDDTRIKWKSTQDFLNYYNSQYQELYTLSAEAEWELNTHIIEGDEATGKRAEEANEALAKFTGSQEVIDAAQFFMKEEPSELEFLQLKKVLYLAGANPASAGNAVKEKIAAETEQTRKLFGHTYMYRGSEIDANYIDSVLNNSQNLEERLEIWKVSKEGGRELKEGLARLKTLRNTCVQALGYEDFFAYQVSDYNILSDEMISMNRALVQEVWPLYRELHTWARYNLAKKYNAEVPEFIPAHWLPNRWGQDWTGLVDVKGTNIDKALERNGPEWIVKKGEEFYTSLGFNPLPASFYERSSLYPLDAGTPFKKNSHASAWHMDLDNDLRSLMSIKPNTSWWETTLHELGHIYYFDVYSRDDVPIILRDGTNRAYHEAVGSLIGLASLQDPLLRSVDLIDKNAKVDTIQVLLKEALNYVVLLPWGAGVMTEFEHALYATDLSPDTYNTTWWNLKRNIQGIEPPEERGADYCDAATKTHINNDPAQYYDYALSYVLLFQLHDKISQEILNEDPHYTNYWGNQQVGDFLKEFMKPGGTVDWRSHMSESLGMEFTAEPMIRYFEPLMTYLQKENEGKLYSLPPEPIFD